MVVKDFVSEKKACMGGGLRGLEGLNGGGHLGMEEEERRDFR